MWKLMTGMLAEKINSHLERENLLPSEQQGCRNGSCGDSNWGNKGFKLNHLLFMNDLKLFAKSKNQIDSLVQTVHILDEDIGTQFGIKKRGVFLMERRKVI